MENFLNVEFWAFVGVVAGIYAVFALGLQLQFGIAGLANFGHVAFMGIGAYTMAILIVKADQSLWIAALAAIATAILFAAVIGLLTLRLRADYLAITTIAFSEIVRLLAVNLRWLTGGPEGTTNLLGTGQATNFSAGWMVLLGDFRGKLNALTGLDLSVNLAMLLIVWAIVGILIVLLSFLVRSPWGRVLKAIREDEDAARALGKNTFWYKSQALMIGAALAALAGLIYAIQFTYFSPQDIEPLLTFFGYVIIIMGGIGSIAGVPIGAMIFGFLFAGTRFFNFPPFSLLQSPERASLRLILVGALIVGIMALRPQGLFGKKEELALDQ
jgi:branched-chain amino acid transport system permease protein